ncbi:MAG TPA: DUF5984 family protein, partial [Terracidiphilus sp.]|nr:DUF5984 family protein [Terracidiphilus sp.]
SGQFVTDVADFKAASFNFLDEVIKQMDLRVQTIAKVGWTRKDCSLDVEALIREQQQRTAHVNKNKARRANTDWASTRGFLERLQTEFGRD